MAEKKLPLHDELLDEMERDNKIDQLNLEREIVRVPSLQTKYHRYHRQYKKMLIPGWRKMERLELELHQYYSGNAPSSAYRERPFNIVVKNQQEMSKWIASDERMQLLKTNIQEAEDCIRLIEEMLESLKFRSNHLATVLEIRKFESGA